MKEFEEYLRRIGKSENTALTYCRNIRMYFSWCRDSFGSEPKELYRSNVLEYISYIVNQNTHLFQTRCVLLPPIKWRKNGTEKPMTRK